MPVLVRTAPFPVAKLAVLDQLIVPALLMLRNSERAAPVMFVVAVLASWIVPVPWSVPPDQAKVELTDKLPAPSSVPPVIVKL